jgi:hypothetical protein
MFSYLSPEQRVRINPPARAIRGMADQGFDNISERFDLMYAQTVRTSIPPEKLPRAQLTQMRYGMQRAAAEEEIDYSALFRWFVRHEPRP